MAVLLELAKILGENPPPIGVNLVFFDGEDMGVPGENETYCQGSRFFAKNLQAELISPTPGELDLILNPQKSTPSPTNQDGLS